MAGVHSGLHGDELNEDLRSDLESRIGRHEASELLFLILAHELDRVVIGGERAENIYKRISRNDGLVGFIVRALGVVLEYVEELLFEVSDRLAVSSVCFCLRRRVSRVKSRHVLETYRRHVESIQIHGI